MSSATFAAMWDEAIDKYAQVTKKKLKDLPRPRSAEDLIQQVRDANSQYDSFREKAGILFKVLSAVTKPIELVGNMAAGAASAAFPPSSMIFGAVMYLIKAAKGVSAMLDAIAGLMEELQNVSVRLAVYAKADLSKELREKLAETLVTMVEILAKSTQKVEDRAFRLKAFGKNVLFGSDTEMQGLLRKLDVLTRSENLLVGAETYVEVKSVSRDVQALQASMNVMQVTSTQAARVVADISTTLDEQRAQLKADKNLSQLEALKELLSPSFTAQDRFEQIRRERRLLPHSGDWILAEANFNSWIAGEGRPLLWIAGNPGSGKSFLTHNILTCLHEHSIDQSSSASREASVGFFFFRDNSPVTQSFRQAFRDIAYQLTQIDPVYCRYLGTLGLSSAHLSSVEMMWKILFEDYWLSDEAPNLAYIVLDGLDEASCQERAIFLDLLLGVEELGAISKLRVVMLGRPHIVQEMTLQGLREPPTIYVDASKNGADIALYVRSSIAKSQSLKRISAKLKARIIETLTTKAGGMFMWAKLMIAELNRKAQRSRESEVEKALKEAPKDLTTMIRHVLEGFADSLPPDEAEDLNTLLRWIALAKQPLSLGQLDAALRLKSEDGAGLVFLEGMLRKTYASLFTLSREDGMTTAELLTQKQFPGYDEYNDSDFQDIVGGGDDDLDYPAELNSHPDTTAVSFSHASISDYLLEPKHGMVMAPGKGASAVGVDLKTAHLTITETCLDIILDEKYRSRMEGASTLFWYATAYWFDHLENTSPELSDEKARSSIGTKLVRMLHDEKGIGQWAFMPRQSFFTPHIANHLISWLKCQSVQAQLDSDLVKWLDVVDKGECMEIFDPIMRHIAGQWLIVPWASWKFNWSAENCPTVIHCWLTRKSGKPVEGVPDLEVDDILAAAGFAGFQEGAEFNRRVARSLRECGHYEEARQKFGKALELDPGMWLARFGLAQVHFLQGEYQQTLSLDETVVNTLEAFSKDDSVLVRNHLNVVFKQMANCYSQLSEQIVQYPSEEVLQLEVKACQHYLKAFRVKKTDDTSVKSCLKHWQMWVNYSYSLPYRTTSKYSSSEDVPARDTCFKEIMSLAHEWDDFHVDEMTHWLWSATDDDLDSAMTIAQAAKATNELQWLRECYSEATSRARKGLKPLTVARVALGLANLCVTHAQDEERALKLWDSVVSERAFITRDRGGIIPIQQEALSRLGEFCLDKALQDEHCSGRYIGKLEDTLKQSRKSVATISEDMIPPSDLALYLGVWYTKIGRHDEAQRVVQKHVSEALALLSDDDPTNDLEGYYNLMAALIAVRDDSNSIAVAHCFRVFRNGFAVLSSDPSNSNSNDDDDDLVLPPDTYCDGPCDNRFSNVDNLLSCRFDYSTFCSNCYTQLCEEGHLPTTSCSGSHEFFQITPLTTRFKKSEIVVDGIIMDFATWKQGIKKKWGL